MISLWATAALACPTTSNALAEAVEQHAPLDTLQAIAACLDEIPATGTLPALRPEDAWTTLAPPRSGRLIIQGVVSDKVPLGQPYLFQRVDGQVVLQSAWVGAGTLAPTYAPRPTPAPSLDARAPAPLWPNGPARQAPTAWVLAGTGAAGAGLLWGLGAERAHRARQRQTPVAHLPGLQQQNHLLHYGAAALGLGASSALMVALWNRRSSDGRGPPAEDLQAEPF